MPKRVTFILGLLCVFLIAGCMSTQQIIDKRIERQQDLFDTFSPEVQTKIRGGHIDIGFSMEMVRMAWGDPDYIHTRRTKSGTSTIWTYTKTKSRSQIDHMVIPVFYLDSAGNRVYRYQSVWIDLDTEKEYEKARIEFTKGLVSAIEQLRL